MSFRSDYLYCSALNDSSLCGILFHHSHLWKIICGFLSLLSDGSFFNSCKEASFKLKFLFNIHFQLFMNLPFSYDCNYEKPGIVGQTKISFKVNTILILLQPSFVNYHLSPSFSAISPITLKWEFYWCRLHPSHVSWLCSTWFSCVNVQNTSQLARRLETLKIFHHHQGKSWQTMGGTEGSKHQD